MQKQNNHGGGDDDDDDDDDAVVLIDTAVTCTAVTCSARSEKHNVPRLERGGLSPRLLPLSHIPDRIESPPAVGLYSTSGAPVPVPVPVSVPASACKRSNRMRRSLSITS